MLYPKLFCAALVLLAAGSLHAVTIDDDVDIQGNHIRVGIHPDEGGTVHTFNLNATPGNFVGPNGLLNEGFGIASRYVPNRRLNEKFEAVETVTDRPILRYSYDCDGPNIGGLSVVRQMEPMPDETSMRVNWSIENKGTERHWVAPWIFNDTAPGGAANNEDLLQIPTIDGIQQARGVRFYTAARNWIAATDPLLKESIFWVFDAEHIHSHMANWDAQNGQLGFKSWFVPQMMAPGAKWQTSYRMGAVRGLSRVDFATDQLAAQIDYEGDKLVVLLAAVRDIQDLQIQARILAPNGRVWAMPDKKFTLAPNRLIRCTYDWKPEGEGAYEFLAQVTQHGEQYYLGAETNSPHGGIDTRFHIGKGPFPPFQPWTNAPYALERGKRTLQRRPAVAGPLTIWAEPTLNKIFQNDTIIPQGAPDPNIHLSLARGEYEGVQIGIYPPQGRDWIGVTATHTDLTTPAGARIPANQISLARVHHHDIRVPSHFEGPTGVWPDALPALTGSFTAPGAECTLLWLTVHAAQNTPPGVYTGTLTLSSADDTPPVTLNINAKVHNFQLPIRPYMKTDFGYWPDTALRGARKRGGAPNAEQLQEAYLQNALQHRVTLREPTQLPMPQSNYPGALARYKTQLDTWLQQGLTSIHAPAELLAQPIMLAEANSFIKRHSLQPHAYTHLAHEPLEPAWERLLQTMQQWQTHAPDIPAHVSTTGLRPFLPESLPHWRVHAQMMDTAYNAEILKKATTGGEIWWYINQTPPRPYANFFIDFQAIEHRILFWQAWALGIKGLYYWNINYTPEDIDPWQTLLDPNPANGNGMLVYPGADGPVNSIRWENIRDGLEDYDYLTLFTQLQRELRQKGGHAPLLQRAEKAYDMGEIIPNLVQFTRDPALLIKKRDEIAGLIEEMQHALNN